MGKSVVLKDLVAALCTRQDLDPRQIIYVTCDAFTARDLSRALTLARELTRSVDRAGTRPRAWLLDEIGAVRGWTAILKSARDNSPVGEDCVVATSSSWRAEEDVEGHLLAGRAGSGSGRRVRLLLPMTFRDYLAVARPNVPLLEVVHPADLQGAAVAQTLEGLRFEIDEYDLAWQAYLTCGGFPRAVAGFERDGAVDMGYLKDLAAWLRRDVDPEAPGESIPLLLTGLDRRASSPLSRSAVAREMGYPSRDVFDRRLNRLVSAFAGLWCPQRDDRTAAVVAGSQAKFYLTDPLLAWLPSRLRAGLDEPDFTRLTEQMIGVSLARAIDALDEGRWVTNDTLGYVRTGSGNEVDLAPVSVPTASGVARTVPLESKWVDRGWRPEALTVEGKYGCGILATKTILDMTRGSWAVPAPLLSMLLA